MIDLNFKPAKVKSTLCLLLLFGWNLIAFSQKFKSAEEYLAYIKAEEINITKSSWKLTAAKAHRNWIRAYEAEGQLLKDIEKAKKNISKIKDGYNGDVDYKDQILRYFDLYGKSVRYEYDKIINVEKLAQQSDDAMDVFMQADELIDKQLNEENVKVDIAYTTFANKHNIQLTPTESEWSKKIKIYNDVTSYYTVVSSICFKVNFTDLSLTEAIEKADLGGIQQNASALAQFADEGLAQLKEIQPYQGDYSVANAAQSMLEYYKKEATEYIPKVTVFLMFNDKFENARKTLESKTENNRTSEETDNFKVMSAKMDTEVASIQKSYRENFLEKKNVSRRWRTVGSDFMTRHIPKD